MTKTSGLVALKTQNFLAVIKSETCFWLSANNKNTFSFNTIRRNCKRFMLKHLVNLLIASVYKIKVTVSNPHVQPSSYITKTPI